MFLYFLKNSSAKGKITNHMKVTLATKYGYLLKNPSIEVKMNSRLILSDGSAISDAKEGDGERKPIKKGREKWGFREIFEVKGCIKVETLFPWRLGGDGIAIWREFGGVMGMILWGLKSGEEDDRQKERDSIEEFQEGDRTMEVYLCLWTVEVRISDFV